MSESPVLGATAPRDTVVDSGNVPIAARDHGGYGPPVLLLHGAGGNLLGWEHFAPMLTSSHRVIAVDLRGHGRSGDAPGKWDWDDVLDDLEAVVQHFALHAPAIVGHSLGGMLAGAWARRHPTCPAAVSLDGHRTQATRPENFHGMPADRLDDDLRRLHALFDAQAESMARPLAPADVRALLGHQRSLAAEHGIDERIWLGAIERGLVERDGHTFVRPSADLAGSMRDSPQFIDSLPVFKQVNAPLLVVTAKRNLPAIPAEFHELMDAFRAGLHRDLALLQEHRPNIRVCELEASHNMVFERPTELAALVTGFLAHGGTPRDQ